MEKKIGRNDPCPCGSGKKFKHCCGKTPVLRALTQEEWEELYHSLNQRLIQYLRQPRFVDDFESAWDLYWDGEYEIEELNRLSKWEMGTFVNFLVFGYLLLSSNRSVIDHFLNKYRADLTLPERTMLDNMRKAFYGVYEVQEVRPGQGMKVKNIFDGTEFEIKEISGSKETVKWDVISGYICKIGEHYEFTGFINFVPRQIVGSLQAMLLNEHRMYQDEIESVNFSVFLKNNAFIVDQFIREYDAKPPVIVNKEGDEIVLCKLTYKIREKEKVLEWFASNSMFDIIPEKGKKTGDSRAHYTWWLKGDVARRLMYSKKEIKEPYSVFADVVIEKTSMTVELTSERRRDIAKTYLKKQLGNLIRLTKTEIKSLEEAQDEHKGDLNLHQSEHDELMMDPEVQKLIKQRMENYYYEEWVDKPIPALGGLTPIEAYSEAPDELEELLKTFEQQELRNKSNLNVYHLDVDKLRAHIAKMARESTADIPDSNFGEEEKLLVSGITYRIMQQFEIDPDKKNEFVIKEDRMGIFWIDEHPIIGVILDIRKNTITVDVLGITDKIISTDDVLYIFPPEKEDILLMTIDNMMRGIARGFEFYQQHNLELTSKAGRAFHAMITMLPEICELIIATVEKYSNKEVNITMKELRKDQCGKTVFIMKRKTLELAEEDFFRAILYPEKFFGPYLKLPQSKIKKFTDRFVRFIAYMASMCLFSLEYKRRYEFDDQRFDNLFFFVYDKQSKVLAEQLLPILEINGGCTPKNIERLKAYIPLHNFRLLRKVTIP